MAMEGYVVSTNQNSNKSTFHNKSFFWGINVLIILLICNEISNIAFLIYKTDAVLTYFYGFIHGFFEVARGLATGLLVIGLLMFNFNDKRDKHHDGEGLGFVILFYLFSLSTLFYFGSISTSLFHPIVSLLMVIIVIVFYASFITYIINLKRYLRGMLSRLPSPLMPIIYITTATVALLFYYFFISFDLGSVTPGSAMYFELYVPFYKILVLCLIHIDMLFLLKQIHGKSTKKNIMKPALYVVSALGVLLILSMSFIESTKPHYLYQAENIGMSIKIQNRDTTVEPLEFLEMTKDILITDSSLSSYMALYEYDPLQHLEDIPVVEETFIMKLIMPDGTMIGNLRVFDESGNHISGEREWMQLYDLDEGRYFVLVELCENCGSEFYPDGDYLFILVVE